MEVKKVLEEIIERDNLDNISLNENTFTIYFGDILNTETKTGDTYYLLGAYVEVPYSLVPEQIRFHREIVNEFETGGADYSYDYSGFVHYGGNFCWGECGVNSILKNALLESKFDENTFYSFYLHFQKYLEVSSHDSGGRTNAYKKLDLTSNDLKIYRVPTKIRYIENVPFISEITEIAKIENFKKVDYSQPYKRVIKEFTSKAFVFKEKTIIPKVVEHYVVKDSKIEIKKIILDLEEGLEIMNRLIYKRYKNEIDNKRTITFQDYLHQLTNKLCRVDGSVLLQNER